MRLYGRVILADSTKYLNRTRNLLPLPEHRGLPFLISRLHDPNPNVQLKTIYALGYFSESQNDIIPVIALTPWTDRWVKFQVIVTCLKLRKSLEDGAVFDHFIQNFVGHLLSCDDDLIQGSACLTINFLRDSDEFIESIKRFCRYYDSGSSEVQTKISELCPLIGIHACRPLPSLLSSLQRHLAPPPQCLVENIAQMSLLHDDIVNQLPPFLHPDYWNSINYLMLIAKLGTKANSLLPRLYAIMCANQPATVSIFVQVLKFAIQEIGGERMNDQELGEILRNK